jgi:hypothetical protein
METKDQKVIKDLLQIKSSFLVVEELNGSVCHIWKNKKSQRHREEGPAFASRGDEQWWRYGEIHREDGPALSKNLGQDGKKFQKDLTLKSSQLI